VRWTTCADPNRSRRPGQQACGVHLPATSCELHARE
jgi:hypothetical protein